MNAQEKDHLLASLHLGAVLPLLSELIRTDAKATQIADHYSLRLRFSTPSGISSTLSLGSNGKPPSLLHLRFLSDKQVNAMFLKTGPSVPLPIWGFHLLPKLGTFQKLTTRLEQILKPEPTDLDDARFRETHLTLLLGSLIPAAVAILANLEHESRHALHPFPNAMAQFMVEDGKISSWIRSEKGVFTHGTGTPETKPDVLLHFRDMDTALAAVQNRLDNLAALGSGELIVEGLIPFADSLSLVMDRVSSYLDN